MIVKLKCVSNIDRFGEESDYITVGKVYDAEKCSNLLFRITDDQGDTIYVLLSGCAHGKFEVVNE